ncbi:conserved hypothetical protein [Methanosalsum zhilinae DSM 4017]|uniref:Uncharacterized protein n=1 Tax=Methanosalsum zhilinae (strain DSM 4017 / NBRC 107636 / OCM 62 / WeN5) TaxID=679901 RepID=F7XNV5_METZD|nr:hypothetical protein [Methanosalsum zhilinae]AEH61312.1 conserved hypothetical protein [Methanosalsum zhilinae DSM 4017]
MVSIFSYLKKDQDAQMHTFEAVIAATIMVGVVIFAVHATAITPLTSSTASVHVENQIHKTGQDVLSALDHSCESMNSDLKEDVLRWDGNHYVWAGDGYFAAGNRSNVLENSSIAKALDLVAVNRGIAHNVEFSFIGPDDTIATSVYIYSGDPSNNAVTASRKILLSNSDFDDMNITEFAKNTSIIDADNGSDFYNIVDIRLTMWRM